MTHLAYMAREDWAQRGTAMASQSAAIREWLGDSRTHVAVGDIARHNTDDRSADLEAAAYLFPADHRSRAVKIPSLAKQLSAGNRISAAAVVLHPYEPRDLEYLKELVTNGQLSRVFVLVWAPGDTVRWWLEGMWATDLHTGRAVKAVDPLMLEATRMMVEEAHNGLSSSRGKDVVVGLIFATRGYALDESAWLRACFAAGGDFRHAESVKTLALQIRAGRKHQVQRVFGDSIFDLIQQRSVAEGQ